MEFKDTGVLALRMETPEGQKELDALNVRAKELKATLKEIERDGGKGSENWKKYKQELKDVTDQADKGGKAMKGMDLSKMTLQQLENHVKGLNKELKGLVPGTRQFVDATRRLQDAEKRLADVRKQVKGIQDSGEDLAKPTLWNKIGNGFKIVSNAAKAFVLLGIVQTIYDLGRRIFDTTAKFEKYNKVLENALGSQKLAQQSMAAIKQMAANTMFTVDQLTDGYVKMVNRGMRPTQQEMVAMADLAASQGKEFDQYVEAMLDAQTGEFERLKEFGIRASKSGDTVKLSFKGMNKEVKNTPEAIQGALVAFGQMNGVAGQNAKMMDSLGGMASNLEDNFTALASEVGDVLSPVFVGILWLLNKAIDVIRLLVKGISSFVTAIKTGIDGIKVFVTGAGGMLSHLGTAVKEFLSGNFDAAKKAYDDAKKVQQETVKGVLDSAKKGRDAVMAIWTDKGSTEKAAFAGKEQGKAYGKSLTDEQKKAAEKRAKELAKERDEQYKQEREAQIAAIADELTREREKVKLKYELKKRELERDKLTAAQRKESLATIEKQLKSELEEVENKHLQKVKEANKKALESIAELESETGQASAEQALEREKKKIEEIRRKRLQEVKESIADESVKAQQIKAINSAAQAALDKLHRESAQKKLDNEKFIIEQERQAEMALLDWKEVQARNNATKLAGIKQERLNTELRLLKDKLDAEEAAEKAKAQREVADKDQLATTLTALEHRYQNERLKAEADTKAKIEEIDKDLHEQKTKRRVALSEAFGALLKGDVTNFLNAAQNIVQGETAAWQKKLAKNMEGYEAIGSMATQAVAFLNDLAQKKAEKAIAEINREKEQKIAANNAELANTEASIAAEQAAELARLEREWMANVLSADQLTALENELAAAKTAINDKYDAAMDAARATNNEAELERLQVEMDAELEKVTETLKANKLGTEKLQKMETDLADKKKAVNVKYNKDIEAAKKGHQSNLEKLNKEALEKERNEKMKAWKAQQKADIATALITGALSVLKALASAIFPVNLVFAALAGVMTAVQIAKIKSQPAPSFDQGGFVARGGRHGARYGDGGIALVDRASGREVGEMEGGEAIISAEQTEANADLIDQMFVNARTPGKRGKPVVPFSKNRPQQRLPMAFRDGGRFESPYFERQMYLFGAKKKKREAEEQARKAEQEAAAAAAEAESYGADAGDGGVEGLGMADAETAAAKAMGEKQVKTLEAILEEGKEANRKLTMVMMATGAVRQAVDGTTAAVRSVEGAVNASNQSGRMDALIGAISSFGK